ncbi:MAG: hypothetical protein RBQ97_01900 [Acholeplasma sp.]|nr:hypothetical protein [Acholeplasma sp.]
MRIDETAYHEYANWKLENDKILKDLQEQAEDIYFRFKHVIGVIGYYYDRLIDDEKYSSDDDIIFVTGFYYLVSQLEEVKKILKEVYKQDIKELNNHAKEINLFLNTIDFQTDFVNDDIESDEELKALMSFDKKVYKLIETKKEVPLTYYEELDVITAKVFEKHEANYYSINNVFLEIADELNIL